MRILDQIGSFEKVGMIILWSYIPILSDELLTIGYAVPTPEISIFLNTE